MLGKVARFDEFGLVHLEGGAVRTGLLFGLGSSELAMRPDQGQQIEREHGQALGHHFFALYFSPKRLTWEASDERKKPARAASGLARCACCLEFDISAMS